MWRGVERFQTWSRIRLVVCAALCTTGCITEAEGAPPDESYTLDAAYSVAPIPTWFTVGNALTAGTERLSIAVEAPLETEAMRVTLSDVEVLLEPVEGGFVGDLDISELDVGNYELELHARTSAGEAVVHRQPVNRSHPVYVVVSTDWDTPDNSATSLDLQVQLHNDHPELLLTHFVGPYLFTEASLTAERRDFLVNWLLEMLDRGDEIGLHIHPYCTFVEQAGIECITDQSFYYVDGDSTGYTVPCSAYSEADFSRLVAEADSLFEANGLPKATSFRAGGWTADEGVLRALAANGFWADTSANNWGRMEEWEGLGNKVLYSWNREHWSAIDDRSQPYYPSQDDAQSDAGVPIGILEVPDNGILVDYVTSDEMQAVIAANWDGTPLAAPVAVSFGFHPSNFNSYYHGRIDPVLSYVDQNLAVNGDGPMVYGRVSDLVRVWEAAPE